MQEPWHISAVIRTEGEREAGDTDRDGRDQRQLDRCKRVGGMGERDDHREHQRVDVLDQEQVRGPLDVGDHRLSAHPMVGVIYAGIAAYDEAAPPDPTTPENTGPDGRKALRAWQVASKTGASSDGPF